MTRKDINEFRRWHRSAALRARRAGADIVYVYAGHDETLLMHFLSPRRNSRGDEYGGSLENRVRLFREVLEDTRDAVGDRCAVAARLAVDELLGDEGITCCGEGREIIEMLAELPDLWDVNISDWENDSTTSRFGDEGFQEPYVAFVKQVTTKPVVGVGRFTSPDTMVSQIERGILDLIGAARPSIADPFLPKKIEEGRIDEIRECIGCNICVSGQLTFSPMRCTQNPSVGEEWRRNWHPEIIPSSGSQARILVVGAGPAGLEATRALGQRGYPVTLAEASGTLGGRVYNESRMPGLGAWSRVLDWRVGRIRQMANVEVYPDNRLTAEAIFGLDHQHVMVATGSKWRHDGVGASNWQPVEGAYQDHVFSADAVFTDVSFIDPVVVFDDDNFYMGGVIAEKLRTDGYAVTLITTAPVVSQWTEYTMEQHRIQERILALGINVMPNQNLVRIHESDVESRCVYSEQPATVSAGSVIMVTSRQPLDQIYHDLMQDEQKLVSAGISSVVAIGDCSGPSTIAAAVHDGHRAARELDATPDDQDMPYRREHVLLEN